MTEAPASGAPRVGRGWRAAFGADLARYRAVRPATSGPVLFLTEQGLWALLLYRATCALDASSLSLPLKRPLLAVAGVAQKLVEMTAGICLPRRARIGPGLYIGHFGNVILHEDTVIGHTCNLSQGVTVGISGRGRDRGTPVIGDRVYLAANVVVAGPVRVGNDVAVAANSLVTRDVPPGVTVMGVPARVVGYGGSRGYVLAPWIEPDTVPDPASEPDTPDVVSGRHGPLPASLVTDRVRHVGGEHDTSRRPADLFRVLQGWFGARGVEDTHEHGSHARRTRQG